MKIPMGVLFIESLFFFYLIVRPTNGDKEFKQITGVRNLFKDLIVFKL